MKIIYITDIHDGLKGLKELFLQTSPDLYLLSGDIIYKAFFSYEKIIDFCTFQEELKDLALEGEFEITPFDFATRVVRFPGKFSEELLNKSITYRHLFNQAAKTMKEKYQLIESLVKKYTTVPTLFLPGNYDIDLQYTALYEMDLHRQSYEFGGLKFAGYGGAPIMTSGIPEKLAVKFHEYDKNGKFYSEPEDFFNEQLPDVAVIHNPAYGYFDRVPSYGNIGSLGIRKYIDQNPPKLVVSGHLHEDSGIKKVRNGTIFLNPSNFGPVDSIHGFQSGGFISEIIFENKEITKITIYRLDLQTKKIENLIEIDCKGEKLIATSIHENAPFTVEAFIRS